ncbi:hypothetical protein RJ640_027254 [Escallonia rubra]|uniref:Protein kinase domain-containing protein n=1 Tax=Escallonia rubra TaxID=112253 RepID=A0AA88R7F0_9ASTE|nr:hypothetical protein RJ640_027254 [Escallonia rubra]
MEIKSSLDPENKYLASWTSDGNPCSGSFEGVACNVRNKVGNISLQGKGLTGRISPAVAGLKCLSGLYLHYNSLTGEIPKEISNLTELSDLYLNVNSLSGEIPREIGGMASLQVLELCCNQLTGNIPTEMGFLKKLSTLALQHNKLAGQIPFSLGKLVTLKRLDLSFNRLSGPIPAKLAKVPQLEVLDVRNNTLFGVVPPALKKFNGGFHYENNPGLCGVVFSALRGCTAWDDLSISQVGVPFAPKINNGAPTLDPRSASSAAPHNQTHCRNSSKFPPIGIIGGVTTGTITLLILVFLSIVRFRRRKQKIGSTSDTSDDQFSSIHVKEFYSRSASPLVSLEYDHEWNSMNGQDGNGVSHGLLHSFKFNLEEVESATQHFSEVNLLGRSKFSAVYKGTLKNGSSVAIKRISMTSCKPEEADFVKGLSLLTSLQHENLVKLRGFCCSKGRGECFFVYDFASKGNLSNYLDVVDESSHVLNWPTRFSIINGIAKGVRYLHSSETNKPGIVHRNISVEKVLIDQRFSPLLMDSGLFKLLADDIVFSALKVSAAMGCLAPEYITTGHFTEKSDVYAFGVIVLQVLCGKRLPTNSMRVAAESCRLEDFIDANLKGEFSECETSRLTKIALACTNELPDYRPTMETVIQELSESTGAS